MVSACNLYTLSLLTSLFLCINKDKEHVTSNLVAKAKPHFNPNTDQFCHNRARILAQVE